MGGMTKDSPPVPGDPPMQLSLQGASHPRPSHWNAPLLPWRQEVPESMPWSSASGGFVTFTGSMMAPSRQTDPPGKLTIKRHSEKVGEGPSRKHFLSEEGMAARFTCLSLSNDHVYGSNGFPVARGKLHTDKEHHFQDLERRTDPPGPATIKRHNEKVGEIVLGGDEWDADPAEKEDVIVEGMFDMSDSRVIVVSSALQRRLESPLEDILPREVLWSISHPCTELILWQPPGNVIQRAIRALRLDGERRGARRESGSEPDPDTGPGREPDPDTFPRQLAGVLQQLEDEMEL